MDSFIKANNEVVVFIAGCYADYENYGEGFGIKIDVKKYFYSLLLYDKKSNMIDLEY